MDYTFIVNTNARSGLGGRVWAQIEQILKARGISYDVRFTKFQRHATQMVKEITADGGEHTIVMLGGDGTVDEVVNGITDLTKVTLGYIPIGSSNDFARFFGLSSDPVMALETVLEPREYAQMNVGVLTLGDSEKVRRFAVSTGFGFDAAVCHRVAVSRMKKVLNKLHLGRLVYLGIALSQMMALRPGQVTILTDDGREETYSHTYFAAAMNHPYQGGGFFFCPKADPCDDVLDVILAEGLSKPKVLTLLPKAFHGGHVGHEGVHIGQCRKVVFESEQAMAVHADGEPIPYQKKISAELMKEKVRVIVG